MSVTTMPATRAHAPTRIDLAGGWTDCPGYRDAFNDAGKVINAAVNLPVSVCYSPQENGIYEIVSAQLPRAMRAASLAELPGNDLVSAVLKQLAPPPCRILIASRVAAGTGLGSSAAVVCAVAGAVLRATRGFVDRDQVCHLSHVLELKLGTPSGTQDQYASVFGGICHLTFPRDGRVIREPLCLSDDFKTHLERSLLLIDSGKSHCAGEILSSVMEALRAGNQQVRNALSGIRQSAVNMLTALKAEDHELVGKAMRANWEHQKVLCLNEAGCPQITTPMIDRIVQVCAHEQALGWKVCGAGGGGYVVAICPMKKRAHIAQRLQHAGFDVLTPQFDFGGLVCQQVTEGGL